MKAPVFKGVGKPLVIEDFPDPIPGPGELLLKVGRSGICGTDLHMTDGHAQTFPEGSVIGHEFAGTVVAVGKEVDGFKLDDVVAALPVVGCGSCGSCKSGEPMWCDFGLIGILGGFGQFAIAKASAAIKLPMSLSLEDGALVEPFSGEFAWRDAGADRARRQGFDSRCGSHRCGAAYWAKRVGAGRIAVTARSNRGAAMALQLGADQFLPSDDNLQQSVHTALGGSPDVIFECTGATGMIAQAVSLVERGAP